MRFHYDKKIDALYIRFEEKAYVESDEVSPGIILDYDRSKKLIGMEVLDASKKFPSKFHKAFSRKSLPVEFDILRDAPLLSR